MSSAPTNTHQPDLTVTTVRDADRAAVLLHPHRQRILEGLSTPDSAAGVARRLGLPRQQVNYHLRELEKAGFVELVEERRRGNFIERVVAATARRFVISPEVLGSLGDDVEGLRDHFSSSYLLATATRTIRELAQLRSRADEAGQRLATMTLTTEVRFASAADRDAFARELTDAVAHLVQRYHDASGSARFRVLLGGYPAPLDDDGGGGDHPSGRAGQPPSFKP